MDESIVVTKQSPGKNDAVTDLVTQMAQILNQTQTQSSSSESASQIGVKLDGTNYALWSQVLEMYIAGNDRLGIFSPRRSLVVHEQHPIQSEPIQNPMQTQLEPEWTNEQPKDNEQSKDIEQPEQQQPLVPDHSLENTLEVQILNSSLDSNDSGVFKLPFRHNRGKPPSKYSKWREKGQPIQLPIMSQQIDYQNLSRDSFISYQLNTYQEITKRL
ncbi:hypothetical protein GH714_011911 [Hevea brasiliensis]|uniref:Retrotransposon Copia-like N-terminal domain-containing protein n=1 Tax=Hevea brasiliensis TaxID=3981 RepID=A0A6A6LNG8_HEVBR|nr:hypothetical protein GH714_011911 [Hevea brasiliensis]